MSEDKHIDIADDLPKCSSCGLPISGVYASFGGNFVPSIAPKVYHLGCIPSLAVASSAPLWTANDRGHLFYCGRVVADMRYAAARGKIQFIVDALNTAEEKR